MTNKKPSVNRDYLASLVAFAKSMNLSELVWEQGDCRVAFKRNVNGTASEPAAPEAPQSLPEKECKPVHPPSHRFVLSPIVGTFMRAPNKRPPLVMEGDHVKAGQRVAAVEAMKVPKDVVSNVSGKVVKILVENGKPVEYNQKLFEIEVR